MASYTNTAGEVDTSRTRVLESAQKSLISDTQETGGVLAWQI